MEEQEEQQVKMVCPFCNAVYTAEMTQSLEYTTEGCSTCGYGREIVVSIEVRCSNCNRVVYRKESDVG